MQVEEYKPALNAECNFKNTLLGLLDEKRAEAEANEMTGKKLREARAPVQHERLLPEQSNTSSNRVLAPATVVGLTIWKQGSQRKQTPQLAGVSRDCYG